VNLSQLQVQLADFVQQVKNVVELYRLDGINLWDKVSTYNKEGMFAMNTNNVENYNERYSPERETYVIKKDGSLEAFHVQKVIDAIGKSARIVGDTMGKYHPHGDSSIYEALVVMSQDFKKGMPLIDGHGNFGNIEGDGAAAMRYTEARLQKVTQEAFLADLDKDVVDFVPNFDETEKEPSVLPVKIPNLLVNGSEGIAVGMATSIPPHNLGEVIDTVKAYMLNNEITTKELMRYLKGPDFPTGGIVINKDELEDIYETGTGKIKLRGKVEFQKGKAGKTNVVITEIPYTMIGANIAKFLSDVAALSETKKTIA
jgi:DNA gyrase subunit A